MITLNAVLGVLEGLVEVFYEDKAKKGMYRKINALPCLAYAFKENYCESLGIGWSNVLMLQPHLSSSNRTMIVTSIVIELDDGGKQA